MNKAILKLLIFAFCLNLVISCPTGWVQGLDFKYCYKSFDATIGWMDAEVVCKQKGIGGHLASIGNGFQFGVLKGLTQNDFWTGGYFDGTRWAWSDNSSWSYTNWAPGKGK